MELFQAGEQDFLRLQEFYKNLIAKTPDMRQFCPWEYGVYPTDALLREHIHNGDFYYMERNGVILAALVLLPYQEENYTWDNPWGAALEDDQVATVHMLGVNPEMLGQGIAHRAVEAAIQKSREMGKKAVRLDALSCNLPAQKLYRSMGFAEVGTARWQSANLGWTDFVLYGLFL